jgi:hypothetical protein
MTRTEIIAQLDAELKRLERARDFLAAALKGSPRILQNSMIRKVTTKLPAAVPPSSPRKSRKPTAPAVAAAVASVPLEAVAAAPVVPPKLEPQIHRVPPRRRMERRQLQTDKGGKSAAALSGSVPAGPVAVSAIEARKVSERAVPAPPAPMVSELRSEIGAERSLGSLIQAFERRAGLSGIEIP